MTESDLRAYLRALPKIELHRHLEGSIRLKTLVEVAQEYDLDLPARTIDGLRRHVQVTSGDAHDANHFMQKFSVLRRFFCSPEVIRRVAREAVLDAAEDGIHYMELRFTPNALARLMGFNFPDVVGWVCDAVEEAQRGQGVKVRLIVSINRHESVREGEKQIQAAIDHRGQGVVGVDLCGHEPGYPADPFFEVFRDARRDGMGICIHAGEWDGPHNVRTAIEKIGAQRIGHGVRIVEDSSVAQIAREAGTTFEVCPTSNVQSGVVYAAEHHPLMDMNYIGLRTTINTDDPSISNITLSDELRLVVERLSLSWADLRRSMLYSAEATFLPNEERAELVRFFEQRLVDPALAPAFIQNS